MAHQIKVVGLGAGGLSQLTFGSYQLMRDAKHLILRTAKHPVVNSLKQENILFNTFDDIYESYESFEQVYDQIVASLFNMSRDVDIVYAVPGHPLIAEKTVKMLLAQADIKGTDVQIVGGQSFLDPLFAELAIDPIEGCQILDATDMKASELQLRHHMIVCQVYDQMVASNVKLTLMERLPDDYPVKIVTAAGGEAASVMSIPLYELDRQVNTGNLTTVYVPPVNDESLLYHDFAYLKDVIAKLRAPDGCPWDRKQTHQSLKKYLVEETYEVLDAIDEADDTHLAEELGDVLLQVMLHAQIGEDNGYFNVYDVTHAITEKMIRRHPHVFGDTDITSSEEVTANWEQIKAKEKQSQPESHLDGVPIALPGLYKAYQYQKKAAKVGFDWGEPEPIWAKIKEELAECRQALNNGTFEEQVGELGDVFFSIVNLCRYYHLDPEEAIGQTNRKFYQRFRYIEQKLSEQNMDVENVTLPQLDRLWDEAKGVVRLKQDLTNQPEKPKDTP